MSKNLLRAALLAFLLPATADAQLLRIGPLGGVSVRAPFVSVDVGPLGGTRVRAPFTSIHAPSYSAPPIYGYGPPPGAYGAPVPDFHSPYFFGFPRDYSRDRDWDYHPEWSHHRDPDLDRHHGLPPASSAPYLGAPLNSPLDAPIPESSYRMPLPEIYRPPAPRYHIPSYSEVFPESAAGDAAQPSEALAGDSVLHDGPYPDEFPLPENSSTRSAQDYSPAEAVRAANRLREAAERLQHSLSELEDGEVWIDYLRCSAVQKLADELGNSRRVEGVSAPQIRSLLANFEGVTANPSLAWVTRLQGFAETRHTLAELVTAIDGEDRGGAGIINLNPGEFGGELAPAPSRDASGADTDSAAEEELPAPAAPVFRGEV